MTVIMIIMVIMIIRLTQLPLMPLLPCIQLQAPNFAYALSTRKFKEALRSGSKIELDLGAVQHMINAAEPVDVKAISEFYKVGSPSYLRHYSNDQAC